MEDINTLRFESKAACTLQESSLKSTIVLLFIALTEKKSNKEQFENAHTLCFSVISVDIHFSLKNIYYKEFRSL